MTAAEIERRRVEEIRARNAKLKALRDATPVAPVPKAKYGQWIDDVMGIVRRLNKVHFELSEVTEHRDELRRIHPDCGDVDAYIRHMLQVLRDRGKLFFHMNGTYTNLELEAARREQ